MPPPVFSSKARQLIDEAIQEITNPAQTECWLSWSAANPAARQYDSAWQHAAKSLPFEVATAAIGALEVLVGKWKASIKSGTLTEDEVCDLDNDISHARSVEKFLVHVAADPSR